MSTADDESMSNEYFRKEGVPDGSDDLHAQWLQKYILENMHVPEHVGITIRVIKKRGRYYVSEWRTGKQTFSRTTIEHPMARLSPIQGRPGRWQLAWMRKDMRWHNLDAQYRGTFEKCAAMIIEDPHGCFRG